MATILIVDDNKNNLQVLGNILNESKYRVAMAINGATALRLAHKAKPDLIILDIMMPEMDGFEVCQRLKTDEVTSEIPIIFLTAKTDLEDVIRGFQLGGVDYITKPFKKEELLVRVRNHINLVESKRVIEKQAEELRAANALKDKLFTVVASDIKNGMSSFIEVPKLLLDDRIDFSVDDFKELIGELKDKAEQTQELLENLLWWTRCQRGLLHPKISKIKVAEVIAEVVEAHKPMLKSKDIEVIMQIGDNNEIIGDNDFVRVIIKNLLHNAIKFSMPKTTIQVVTEDKDDSLQLRIEDQGVGMDEETIAKVLDKYTYVSEFGTSAEKGNGIGLKLVTELVEIMEATLEIKSQPDAGTSVAINFPTNI